RMIPVDTKNILFICGGAFEGIESKIAHRMNSHVVGFNTDSSRVSLSDKQDYLRYVAPQDLRSYGLIPEIIGRLPIITHLEPLSRDALLQVLTEPKNAITRQYIKLFAMDHVKLSFDPEMLNFVVDKAIEYKLGARGLRAIVEAIMVDAMYDIPSNNVSEFTVTLDYAREKFENAHFNAAAVGS
ncbi:MAG: AAA family ATPase, partial [Muribaculaceae bacterium]